MADRVARRLVAGDDEQQEERTELARRELVLAVLVFDLGLHERGRDVVARVVEPVLARASRPYWNSSMPAPMSSSSVCTYSGSPTPRIDVRELEDALGVGARDAEHVADDLQRERGRDLAHEVALAAAARPRSTISRACSRTISSIFATWRGREAAVHDQPQLRVLRRVHVDHRAEPLRDLGRDVADVDARRGVERLGIAAHLHHVGVARERPEARTLREVAPRAAAPAPRGTRPAPRRAAWRRCLRGRAASTARCRRAGSRRGRGRWSGSERSSSMPAAATRRRRWA